MPNFKQPGKIHSYHTAWISALKEERAAALAFLDERHYDPDDFEQHESDKNSYAWGRLGKHNVVIASLPASKIGNNPAAAVTSQLLASLPWIKVGLMVGIGAGLPRYPRQDIRLGDVVISVPNHNSGGVIQHDKGAALAGGTMEPRGVLSKPPTVLLNAVKALQAEHILEKPRMNDFLRQLPEDRPGLQGVDGEPGYIFQNRDNDNLFESSYVHAIMGESCQNCDLSHRVIRADRPNNDPRIHYGVIASGNLLVKDADLRDEMFKSTEYKDCLCLEMEAAGLMDSFPCLVIRGISDYADSHKNDQWQPYAAAVAAAYAKELLDQVPVRTLATAEDAKDVIKRVETSVTGIHKELQDHRSGTAATDLDAAIERLPVTMNALHDSQEGNEDSRCLEGTRVDLLNQIMDWTQDPNAKTVLWLQGKAGEGKSTIARTIADKLSVAGSLGATFFFKRGEADRVNLSKFFTTIARQLAKKHRTTAPFIKSALEREANGSNIGLALQLQKFILEPLMSAFGTTRNGPTIVFIIDALDECDDKQHSSTETDIKLLIRLLVQARNFGLRIFITSRPDLHINIGFREHQHEYQDLDLHQVPDQVIERDISKFLKYQMELIRKNWAIREPQDQTVEGEWPSNEDFTKLAQISIPFIFADTICRFLGDDVFGSPSDQLKYLLSQGTEAYRSASTLINVYEPVVNRFLADKGPSQRQRLMTQFEEIVGSIVLLADYLPISALASLLDKSPHHIRRHLDNFHSVLDVPKSNDHPVRILHVSFRDYLTTGSGPDEQNSEATHLINLRDTHTMLANKCIHRMRAGLKRDICDIRHLEKLKDDIDQNTIEECIPTDLKYACLYWVYHLNLSGISLTEEIRDFLYGYFLYWLEALSLLGRLSDGALAVTQLLEISQRFSDPPFGVVEFLYDTERVVSSFGSIIGRAPLQTYSSLLLFCPEGSDVRGRFWNYRLPKHSTVSGVNQCWNAHRQTLEGHGDQVRAVAFSPDGQLIASSSYDGTVRLWNAGTGIVRQTLEGHGDWGNAEAFSWVHAVAFSPDGQLVASASFFIIQLWDVGTGTARHTLEGYHDLTMAVAFSPDSQLVVSGSEDGIVRLWNVGTGIVRQTLEGHDGRINTVAFSPDSQLVASGSDDGIVRLWGVGKGTAYQTLEDHGVQVNAVALSPDGQLVASAAASIIQLWDVGTGTARQTLKGHKNPVTAVALSGDSRLLASASYDGTIRLWDAGTGTARQTLEGPRGWISAVAISPDGQLVASASYTTIWLWDVGTGTALQTLEGHWVNRILAFDPLSSTRLLTDWGIVNLSADPSANTDVAVSETTGICEIGLSDDGAWIVKDNERLVWLPPDYRPTASDVWGSTVCIGCKSGRALLVTIPDSEWS